MLHSIHRYYTVPSSLFGSAKQSKAWVRLMSIHCAADARRVLESFILPCVWSEAVCVYLAWGNQSVPFFLSSIITAKITQVRELGSLSWQWISLILHKSLSCSKFLPCIIHLSIFRPVHVCCSSWCFVSVCAKEPLLCVKIHCVSTRIWVAGLYLRSS